MNIAIENLPVIFLSIIGIGVAVMVVSVIHLAGLHQQEQDYFIKGNPAHKTSETANLEELFSDFLQEEEKKNESFRQMVLQTTKEGSSLSDEMKAAEKAASRKEAIDQDTFNEIIKRYEQGEDAGSIAKSLKKGIGEVKLIISLYSMR